MGKTSNDSDSIENESRLRNSYENLEREFAIFINESHQNSIDTNNNKAETAIDSTNNQICSLNNQHSSFMYARPLTKKTDLKASSEASSPDIIDQNDVKLLSSPTQSGISKSSPIVVKKSILKQNDFFLSTKNSAHQIVMIDTCYERKTNSPVCCAADGRLRKALSKLLFKPNTLLLMFLLSLTSIILIGLVFISLANNYRYDKICLTKTCVQEAAKIIRSIDETMNPCNDFYQFVCGQWMESTIIPEHKPLENKFDELHDVLNRQIKTVLEQPIDQEKDVDFVQNLKRFYSSCMNTTQIDKKQARPLMKILDELGGWPVLQGDNWLSEKDFSLVNIHRKLNELGIIDDMIIPLIITSNDRNNTQNVIAIKEPSFGLMNREFMIKQKNDTAIRSYFALMLYSVQMLLEQKSNDQNDFYQVSNGEKGYKNKTNSFGTESILKHMDQSSSHKLSAREFSFDLNDINISKQIFEEMKQVLEFEQLLANSSMKKEERVNVSLLFNNMTLQHLHEISPNVAWLDLINIFTENALNEKSEIVVIDLNYVKFLSEILPKTPKRLLANYILWRVVKSKIGVLDSVWRGMKQTYNAINLGHPKIEPRWMQCVAHTHATLGTALSNIYVKNHFSSKEKEKIEKIVLQIRAQLNQTISETDWMDAQTKQHALDKLSLMNFRIGFPDEVIDDQLISKFYQNLTLTDDYFDNVISIHRFEVSNAFKSLHELNSRDDWRKFSEVVDVNAYYFHQENAFILNAGILQDRFFNPNRPNYLNYGSIGEIIGHEITHGFDSMGKQFDKNGQLKNWWESTTDLMYEEKASCIIKQYSQYYYKHIDMFMNGAQTKDENIADNSGVTLSYKAYRLSHQSQNEPLLPGLNYTAEQLFWISYGLENCEKMTAEMLKLTLQIDTHSPGQFRLNGVVSNSEDFARDFSCLSGTPMNPKSKCKVW